MTKNKTLAVVLCVVFALVLVVALGHSIFSVGQVELVAHTTTNHLSSLNESTVLSSSKLNKGKSVFLLDRQDYIDNLERNQPYIKVLALEVAWPNTVKFHFAEREELFAIALNDDAYVYVDEDFKVLRVVNSGFVSTQQNPILVGNVLDVDSAQINAGDFLDKDKFFDYLGLSEAYKALGYTIGDMRSMLNNVSVATNTDGDLLSINTYLGVKINILNAGYYTSQKVDLAYQMLETLTAAERSKGTIYVFKNSQNVLESMYAE